MSQKADDAQTKLWEDATMTAELWTVEMSVHDKLMWRGEHCEMFHKDVMRYGRHGPFVTQTRDKLGRTKGEMGFEICSGCWPDAQAGCDAFLAFHEGVMKKGSQNLDAEERAMKIPGLCLASGGIERKRRRSVRGSIGMRSSFDRSMLRFRRGKGSWLSFVVAVTKTARRL